MRISELAEVDLAQIMHEKFLKEERVSASMAMLVPMSSLISLWQLTLFPPS